ncbi:MAG: class I SAM-dependent methyltransferase [Qipengyuania pacifica]
MHPNPQHRRNLVNGLVPDADARIVEIGALNGPTFRPNQRNIRFIDYAYRDQLIEDTLDNPLVKPEDIVEVDYAIQHTNYIETIDDRFDLAIANHVIEHIADIAHWFINVHGILDEGGLFFLSVPDKRYTFDYLRRETSITDIVRARSEAYTKPTASMLFEHYYYRRPVSAEQCWNGDHEDVVAQCGMPLNEALSHALRNAKSYTSTHCHVFTCASFEKLIGEMKDLGYAPFDLINLHDVDHGANEFHAVLRKI